MRSLSGARVAVVGGGTSGLAAARLAHARGAWVSVVDLKGPAQLGPGAEALAASGVNFREWEAVADLAAGFDVVVVSPGVPPFPELDAAVSAGVTVVGEVEFSTSQLVHCAPIVAVGGTNGKSTVTSLVAAMSECAGVRTFAGGNLGEPLASHADEAWDRIVLEVSSYQMERVAAFRPAVSVLLNITPDHLDRYPNLEAYAAAKGNAFVRQTAQDFAVVPHGDAACILQAHRGAARVLTFGVSAEATVQIRAGELVDHRDGERYSSAAIALRGGHNMLNVAASICAARAQGISAAAIRAALADFKGLAHRVEFVCSRGGVNYYDDSKGTNVGAAVTAVLGLSEPRAVVILGGRDKGGSYEPLVCALAARARGAILIGEAQTLLQAAIGTRIPVCLASSIEAAVIAAADMAQAGDAVLLSPACSSFDMFRDYKHRGDAFAAAARALPESV